MKYFKGKYWDMVNSSEQQTREEGYREWANNDAAYAKYIETIEEKLPKYFYRKYLKLKGFHDFGIKEITIVNAKRGGTSTVKILIEKNIEQYELRYNKVTSYNLSLPSDHMWLFEYMRWGYCEFELLDDGTWVHRILCEHNCEYTIYFKTVGIKKHKSN